MIFPVSINPFTALFNSISSMMILKYSLPSGISCSIWKVVFFEPL